MTNKKNAKRKIHLSLKQALIALLVLSSVLSLVLVSGVYAKYIYTDRKEGIVNTNDFYFESNLLGDGYKEYVLAAGTDKIEIELKNYADDFRISALDISLSANVTGGASAECTLSSQTLKATTKDTATLTLSGLENGQTYVVTVDGVGGYKKTLNATFKVLSAPEGYYQNVQDMGAYLLLTVWTENSKKTFDITPPDTLIPDNTWVGMTDLTVGQSISKSLDEYSSVTYRFFKGENYNGDAISVKVGEDTVPTKAISQ